MGIRRVPPDAFERYVALGPDRSYAKLAKAVGVSTGSIAVYGQREEWQRRIMEMEEPEKPIAKEGEANTGRPHYYRLDDDEKKIIESYRNTGTIPDRFQVLSDTRAERIVGKLNRLNAKYSAMALELDAQIRRGDLLVELSERTYAPVMHIGQTKRITGDSESISASILSDIHAGSVVDPATVLDLNFFNVEEMIKRLRRYFRKVAYLVALLRERTSITEHILFLLGDLVSGDIHEELREENELTPSEAVILLVDLLEEGIKYFIDALDLRRLIVPCVIGNHGRTTKKIRHGSGWKNSYEFLLYQFLAKTFQHDKRIEFQITKGSRGVVALWDQFEIGYQHGSNIKGGGGVGGIAVPVNRAILKQGRTRRTDLELLGHFHQSKADQYWIANGSIEGWSPYAQSINADYEPPQQTLFTIKRDIERPRVSFVLPIFLDERGE